MDPHPEGFTEVGDIVFFSARNRGQLWRTDGTGSGTVVLRGPSVVTQPIPYADRLFFSAEDDDHGQELWMSDGTAAGTRVLKDICRGRCGGLGYAVEFVQYGADLSSRV